MSRAVLKALAVGAAVALAAFVLGCALFRLAVIAISGGDNAGAGLGLVIFSPVLVLVLTGSVALGLLVSHRLRRRSLARRR